MKPLAVKKNIFARLFSIVWEYNARTNESVRR